MKDARFDALTRSIGRRSLLKGLAGSVGGLFAGTMVARQASARDLTICHATGDAESPYETMTVSQAEFNLHARHGDFLRVDCCGDSDCGTDQGACSGICQNGYCAPLPKPAGTPCVFDETQEGACDEQGICQPPVCTAAPTCNGSSDCPDGNECINGGCFSTCSSNSDCADDCTSCTCQFGTESSGKHCLDANTFIGKCITDGDCPAGTLCSSFFTNGGYLCTQPCPHLQ